MAFGMKTPVAADFTEIAKFDARAGRLFRIDYDPNTRTKTQIDITTLAPRFAIDFGSLEIGYAHFAATGPVFHVVPEGQPLPKQPLDKDDQGRLMFKPVFRVKIFGKILLGLREWSSSANAVTESVDDLYGKFRASPEAQTGRIPIVELSKTIPVQMGKGARQTTVYTPAFSIVGWAERVAEMGLRTVPIPQSQDSVAVVVPITRAPVAAAAPFVPAGITSDAPLPSSALLVDDDIPF